MVEHEVFRKDYGKIHGLLPLDKRRLGALLDNCESVAASPFTESCPLGVTALAASASPQGTLEFLALSKK
jgi:hypothetical protein